MQLTPRILNKLLWTLFFAGIAAYLFWMASPIFFPPQLIIFEPKDNFSTTDNKIVIKGRTNPKAALTINGIKIYNDKESGFAENLDIASGFNTFTIKAVNGFGRENIKVLKVVKE